VYATVLDKRADVSHTAGVRFSQMENPDTRAGA
jgi:hypothetical protein